MNTNYKKISIILLMNFLLAISTTIGMTIIPILVTDSLGLSLLILGLIEGTSEFISNVLRLTNGILFDKTKNKKRIFLYPTSLACLSKAMLLLPTAWSILLAKIVERISNGAFASPRDAYVAENATNKGFALSLISFSKSLGCVLGPLIVSIYTFFFGNLNNHINLFVFLCCSTCLLAMIFSAFIRSNFVENTKFSFHEVKAIFKNISPIILLGSLFFMGRFNDGLVILYLKHNGFPEWFYLSAIAIFNFTMLLASPFIGAQIDYGNAKKMLFLTIGALVLFNICFYQINLSPWPLAIIGLITWGIQRTGAQIVFSTLVFKAISRTTYGTGIGLFYITSGFSTMLSSFTCGYLANTNFASVFLFSGTFAFIALVIAWAMMSQNKLAYQAG